MRGGPLTPEGSVIPAVQAIKAPDLAQVCRTAICSLRQSSQNFSSSRMTGDDEVAKSRWLRAALVRTTFDEGIQYLVHVPIETAWSGQRARLRSRAERRRHEDHVPAAGVDCFTQQEWKRR